MAASGGVGGHDGYFIVTSGIPSVPQCAQASSYCSDGGTSAAAPSFAGIIALLNYYAARNGLPVNNGGQGNINPTLYKLFATTPNAFHDITTGSNIVNCQIGTPDCTTGSYGFSAGPGYDPVTGLGSVDANNLVTQWYGKTVTSTSTSVIANPASFTVSSATLLTATVSGSGGTPSGTVSFEIAGKTLGTVTLSSGRASLSVSGGQFATGIDTIAAVYSGDSNFAGSSATTAVTVTLPVNSSAVVPTISPNPVPELPPDAAGFTWWFQITLTETAGTATTLTGLTVGGVDYSTDIVSFFGTASIAARGSITASLSATGYTPPISLPFVFSGVDASGQTWTQSASITLLGPQQEAAISLISAPAVVYQNTAAASNCQWFQNLEVQELDGFGVTLNRFLAAGIDLSSQIKAYFKGTQLSPFGSLQAGICWSGIVPPEPLTYELDGTDVNGNTITTSTAVTFQGAPATVTALTLSKSSVAFELVNRLQSASTTVEVNVAPGVAWSITVLPSNRTTSWLTVVPSGGVGPAIVTVAGSGGGLLGGVFEATLTVQAPQALPSFVNVPVILRRSRR
jgi:hypothetical protein